MPVTTPGFAWLQAWLASLHESNYCAPKSFVIDLERAASPGALPTSVIGGCAESLNPLPYK